MANQLTIKGGGISQAAVLALITANAAPPAHKTQHQNGGSDALDLAGLAGKINYVNRGNLASFDWTISNFSVLSAWTDLDCSSIVPSTATHIHFRSEVMSSTADNIILSLKKKGYAGDQNAFFSITPKQSAYASSHGIIECDANRFVQYYKTANTLTVANVAILGWFLP